MTATAELARFRALVAPVLAAAVHRPRFSLYDPEQPRTPLGKLLGRPRGDAGVLAVLNADGWTLAATVAERLGLKPMAAYQRLIRAQRRGLIDHAWGKGYRRTVRDQDATTDDDGRAGQ